MITAFFVARIQSISSSKESVMSRYPELFTGLGSLSSEYKISLKPDAKPYVLYTARRVPISLRSGKELTRMESLGVISQIDKPSPWCAGVPKPSGKVRIYADMKPFNENVMREFHPLPAVDETLAQLSGQEFLLNLMPTQGSGKYP